jgi:hypothetical protein
MGLGGASVTGFDGATPVADNEWHHVAGTYDGSNATLYIDGIADTIVEATGKISTNPQNLFLGENSQARGRYFKGLLDDVCIYDRALSDAEVAQLAGITGPVNPVQVSVPNVVGMTETAARSAVIAAGLVVGTVTQASSSTVA